MATKNQYNTWRVKLTRLPVGFTKQQLATQLQISISRIFIRKDNRYAWIDGFDHEDDAQIFATRNSEFKCSVHPPQDRRPTEQHQPQTMKPARGSRSSSISKQPFNQSSTSTLRSSSVNIVNRIDSSFEQTTARHNPKLEHKPSVAITELSQSQHNFLAMFGKEHLDKIRCEEGIDNVIIQNGQIQLIGHELTIKNVTTYLRSKLYERVPSIEQPLARHLQWARKMDLLKEFREKYRVGISYSLSTDDTCEQHEDNDESKVDYETSSNQSNDNIYQTDQRRNLITVTLCNDSEDRLSKAVKKLEHDRLYHDSWMLAEEEVAFIDKQAPAQCNRRKRQTLFQEQSFRMKQCLLQVIRGDSNSIADISVNHTKNGWQLKVSGLQNHVEKVVSKLKEWLDENVQSEEQLPISKVMAIFLRTKASADIKKLEKEQSIKILIYPPHPSRQRQNEKEDNDDNEYHCLKITGSKIRLRTCGKFSRYFM